MSISSEITRITNKRDASFAKVALKGVIVPSGSTIDDLPDLIDSISIDPTYSVTKNLTSVTSSCDDTKVIQGNSFFTELTPASGYVISSITVTMGGVDITDQVFKAGTGAKTITANGTYSAADDNLSGYTAVSVAVPSQSASLGTKSITSNGTYYASSDGYDGYSQVNVSVSGGTPNLQSKTKSYTPSETAQSETVSADTGYDGLSSVAVSVGAISSTYVGSGITQRSSTDLAASTLTVTAPSGYYSSSASKTLSDANLLAENIKKNISIFGVTGSYEGGGSTTAATGEITLSSAFSLTTSPQNIPNLQLSFQPDFFYIIRTHSSWNSSTPTSAGLHGLIAVKKSLVAPYRISNNVSTDSVTGDYLFVLNYNVSSDTSAAGGYALNGFSMLGTSYYSRYAVNSNGTISVGRYSSASTKMPAGTYRYFALKTS